MREACHHNLYAMANSSGMNGIGAETTIKAVDLPIIGTIRTAMVVCWILFAGMTVLWILGRRKWKKSEAHLNYKTMVNTIKAERKQSNPK